VNYLTPIWKERERIFVVFWPLLYLRVFEPIHSPKNGKEISRTMKNMSNDSFNRLLENEENRKRKLLFF
jgi:hypothetical protein